MTASEFYLVFGEDFNFWGEDPNHPVEDWVSEVHDGNTRLGYWDWVLAERDRIAEE